MQLIRSAAFVCGIVLSAFTAFAQAPPIQTNIPGVTAVVSARQYGGRSSTFSGSPGS